MLRLLRISKDPAIFFDGKTCIMMGPNIKISLPAQRLRTSMDNMETQPLDLSEVPELDEEDL